MISTIVLAYPPHLEVRMDFISQNKPFSLGQYFEGFITVVASETVTDVLKRSFVIPRLPSSPYYPLLPTLAAMNLGCSETGSAM